jgi:uncharacterized protein YegP (UPF0339 family)
MRTIFGRLWAWVAGPAVGGFWNVYQDDSGQWRWRLKAGNGEVVAQGEAHRDATDALRAADGVDRIVRQARRRVTGVEGRTRL